MRLFAAAVFLAILVGFFARAAQERLRRWLHKAPRRVFLVPLGLTAFFAGVLAVLGAADPRFIVLLFGYTLGPTFLVFAAERSGARIAWLDFVAILLLWLPVEFASGKQFLRPEVFPVAVIVAHGTAAALGLFLFLAFRDLPGMKYNRPTRWADLWNPLIGFAIAAPPLIFLGLRLSFLGGFRTAPAAGPAGFARTFFIILAAVAIPEELLFRSLIQNWLMQRFGFSNRVLLGAAVIFGAAHLDNPPGPLPNWRYMILATIAGFIYGKVFQKSSTILSSAGLHALVNTVRHLFFL